MRRRPCWVCDKPGHLNTECRKKKSSGCLRCGKEHQLRDCPSRPKTTVAGIMIVQDSLPSSLLATINHWTQQVSTELLKYRVRINEKWTQVLIDTGAQLSLIAKTEAVRLGVTWKSQLVEGRVETADGGVMNILGMANVLMNYETGVRR